MLRHVFEIGCFKGNNLGCGQSCYGCRAQHMNLSGCQSLNVICPHCPYLSRREGGDVRSFHDRNLQCGQGNHLRCGKGSKLAGSQGLYLIRGKVRDGIGGYRPNLS